MKHIMINYNLILDKKTFNYIISILMHSYWVWMKKNIIEDWKNLEDLFDFINLNKNHEIFSNKNEKVVGKVKLETPRKIWIAEFVCLRSNMYSFKCGDDFKNKIKGIWKSQSKHNKFKEYYNCLFGGECQKDCGDHIVRLINHEMYLERV